MKLYIACSRAAGSEEGAILVAAHTSREAKKLAWCSGDCWNIDGWTDLAIKLIRDHNSMPLADQEKIKCDIAHVVNQPVGCENCQYGALVWIMMICVAGAENRLERLIKTLAHEAHERSRI